jgi:hypothetical protein
MPAGDKPTHGFLVDSQNNACLDIKDGISFIPLRKDSLLFRETQNLPALGDGCEECMGIKSASPIGR